MKTSSTINDLWPKYAAISACMLSPLTSHDEKDHVSICNEHNMCETFTKDSSFLCIGMTPLLAAAVTGHIHIVEFLIGKSGVVGRKERIDALELLGATFVDKKRDMLGSFKLWKRAMEERYSPND